MANFITMLRIAAAPVFVFFLARSASNPDMRYAALAIFVFGAMTDWADGFVARRTNTVTRFGITADPLADRLFIGAALVSLYAMRILPLLFVCIVLGRDLLMMLGYPLIGRIDRETVAVHWTGKVATAILFAALACLVLSPSPHQGARVGFAGYDFFNPGSWQFYGLWLFAVGSIWSLISGGVYVSRAISMAAKYQFVYSRMR